MQKYLDFTSLLLIIIGGVNWLLVGLMDFNLVYFLFHKFPVLEKGVYCLVGISAIYALSLLKVVYNHSYEDRLEKSK